MTGKATSRKAAQAAQVELQGNVNGNGNVKAEPSIADVLSAITGLSNVVRSHAEAIETLRHGSKGAQPLPASPPVVDADASRKAEREASRIRGKLEPQLSGWSAEMKRLFPDVKMVEQTTIDGKTFRFFDEEGRLTEDGDGVVHTPKPDLKVGKVQPIDVNPIKRRYFAETMEKSVLCVEVIGRIKMIDAEGRVVEQLCEMGELELKRFNGGNHGLMGDLTLDIVFPDGQRAKLSHANDCMMLKKVTGSINDNG